MSVRPAPFRSVLFAAPNDAPQAAGSQVPTLRSALDSEASVLLFDLEDTVPEAEKPNRRSQIQQLEVAPERMWVRINHEDHDGWTDDLVAAAASSVVMVPKVESAGQLSRVRAELGRHGSDAELVALIETAKGLLTLQEICDGETPPLALCLGIGDLTRDTNTIYSGMGEFENYARCRLIEVSAAFNLAAPIDTASLFVGDEDFVRDECRLARRMGFASKLCLTLADVRIVNDAFQPTADEIEQAQAIVDAYQHAIEVGQGQVVAHGVIVDVPTVQRARDVLRAAAASLSRTS